MVSMKHILFAFMAMLLSNASFALQPQDEQAIFAAIEGYAHAWNEHDCHGFADDFTEEADFVNIFGMHFSGKKEIEERHVTILETFLKGTKLRIAAIELREEQPGIVIATAHWFLSGYVKSNPNQPDIEQGIFSHVFVNRDGKWKICATQNTLITRPHRQG